jgi:hypothetical protein
MYIRACIQWQTSYTCTGCGSECWLFTSATGTFSDGSGTSNYPSMSKCEWMIASPTNNGSLIVIQFDEFSTQPLNDVMRVFQCSDVLCTQQQQLAELSGRYPSVQSITSGTSYMKVVFTSDSVGEYDGFTASWSMVCALACGPICF